MWVDVDLDDRTSPRQWLHFATWGSNTEWRVWTMSVVGENEDLDLGQVLVGIARKDQPIELIDIGQGHVPTH